MVTTTIDDDRLVVDVQGLDRLWTLRSGMEIPLEHVRGARIDPDALRSHPRGLRLLGTRVPGVVSAGTFLHDGDRVFWDVHHADGAVVIDLDDERYRQLIVEVADPAGTVDRIMTAVGHPPTGA